MAQDIPPQTPGQVLRAARLARGATLDEAHEGTKIPLRLLEAIERDEYHQLSDALYIKSFLRNYASWAGADAAAVVGLYDQIAGRPDAAPTGRGAGMVWTEDQVSVTHIGTPWRRFVVSTLVVAVIAAAAVWFLWLRPARSDLHGTSRPPAHDSTGAAPVVDAQSPPGAGPAAGSDSTWAPGDLPTPVRGDPALLFHGGEQFALVLRVLLPREANCSVRRDGQAAAVPVIWPQRPLALPAANLRHGEAYAVQGGYVAYWGANDNFTLILDPLPGTEVTLNGVAQPVQRWRPNQPVILDRAALGAGH